MSLFGTSDQEGIVRAVTASRLAQRREAPVGAFLRSGANLVESIGREGRDVSDLGGESVVVAVFVSRSYSIVSGLAVVVALVGLGGRSLFTCLQVQHPVQEEFDRIDLRWPRGSCSRTKLKMLPIEFVLSSPTML